MMRYTYHLCERTPCECRLTPTDIEFLLAHHRRHVRLLPTGREGVCRVIPTGHVGTLVTPTCCLHIQPKIPIGNLFYLLGLTTPPAAFAPGEVQPRPDLLNLLAGVLAQLLEERAKAGLHRDYAEQRADGPFLHGQLDVAAQLREGPGRKERLHCQFAEWTADVPCNQVPRAAAELLLRSPLVQEPARSALTQALTGFAAVRPVSLDEPHLAAAAPQRLTESYRPLWELCRLLAASLLGGAGRDDAACPAFLVDMERVFEEYVARELPASLSHGSEFTVAIQPWLQAAHSRTDQPPFQVRPDLILQRGGEACAVLDTKWKRQPRTRLLTADVYQVLAYCATVGVQHAVLVYPGRGDRAWTYPLERSPVQFAVQTIRVAGSPEQCRQSLRRLARNLAAAV